MQGMKVQYIMISRVSESEQIIFLSCRDQVGKARLFYIWKGEVKSRGRLGWQEVDSGTVAILLKIAGSAIYRSPTYKVNNLAEELYG
jgi:hypothetical protein